MTSAKDIIDKAEEISNKLDSDDDVEGVINSLGDEATASVINDINVRNDPWKSPKKTGTPNEERYVRRDTAILPNTVPNLFNGATPDKWKPFKEHKEEQNVQNAINEAGNDTVVDEIYNETKNRYNRNSGEYKPDERVHGFYEAVPSDISRPVDTYKRQQQDESVKPNEDFTNVHVGDPYYARNHPEAGAYARRGTNEINLFNGTNEKNAPGVMGHEVTHVGANMGVRPEEETGDSVTEDGKTGLVEYAPIHGEDVPKDSGYIHGTTPEFQAGAWDIEADKERNAVKQRNSELYAFDEKRLNEIKTNPSGYFNRLVERYDKYDNDNRGASQDEKIYDILRLDMEDMTEQEQKDRFMQSIENNRSYVSDDIIQQLRQIVEASRKYSEENPYIPNAQVTADKIRNSPEAQKERENKQLRYFNRYFQSHMPSAEVKSIPKQASNTYINDDNMTSSQYIISKAMQISGRLDKSDEENSEAEEVAEFLRNEEETMWDATEYDFGPDEDEKEKPQKLDKSDEYDKIHSDWVEANRIAAEDKKRNIEWSQKDKAKKGGPMTQRTLDMKPLFNRGGKSEHEMEYDKQQSRAYTNHALDRVKEGKEPLFRRRKYDEYGDLVEEGTLHDVDVGDKDTESFKASASDIIEHVGYIDNIMNKVYTDAPPPRRDGRKGRRYT